MVEIHWTLILVIAVISGCGGFMLCSLLVMAKQSDEAMEELHRKWDDDAAKTIKEKYVKEDR